MAELERCQEEENDGENLSSGNGDGVDHSKHRANILLHEVYFFPLRHQSNIYGLLDLCINGSNKLVVSTLPGEVYSLEFHDPLVQRPPQFKPITFSYIPVGVEVVSINAIAKEPNGVVIGITLIRTETDPNEVYFNLYGIHSNSLSTFQWENIADDWQPLNLKYTPFQVTTTKILAGDHWEPVFLVSGDDNQVHLYREISVSSEPSFQEEAVESFFPELTQLSDCVTFMDIHLVGMHRLTAVGCQTGKVCCTLVDLVSNVVVKKFSSELVDGPITSVKLFTLSSEGSQGDVNAVHLLLTSAVEIGVVFLNVLRDGFEHSVVLPSSQSHDSVLCSAVADVNWDGTNEILLGTYGKEILAYTIEEHAASVSVDLAWRRSFSHPIHSIWYGDITGDGLSELAVLSMGGLHLLQHNLEQACELCIARAPDLISKK